MSSPSSNGPIIPYRHILQQFKFIIPGGAVVYYFDTLMEFWGILRDDKEGWGRTAAFGSLTLGCTTIALFMYIILMPLIRGEKPNYTLWRQHGVLSRVIPILTSVIIFGWLLLTFTLWQYSNSGFFASLLGACAVYALTFGLLGLIPAPKVRRH